MHPPTFICSCGHSGTSLIANILAAHPEVFVPQEETMIFLGGEDRAIARLAELVATARSTGRRLVEKTPRHIRRVDRIRRLAPGARFVVPVRDGRDVVASFLRRHGDFDAACDRWIADNEIVLRERGAPDVLVYRHEDLVADPAAVLRRVCEHLDLPYRDDLLHYHDQPRLWFGETEIRRGTGVGEAEHRALRNWQINQPIFDSGGRWQRVLTPEQAGALTAGRAAELMRAFGYRDDDDAQAR